MTVTPSTRFQFDPDRVGPKMPRYVDDLPGGLTRQYSLCNDPSERHRYLIGVLKDPASRGGSQAMHERVKEMHTDIGRDAAGLRIVPFPRAMVPASARGDRRRVRSRASRSRGARRRPT